MNKVFLIGNLTKNVELRQTTSGKSVVSMTIAVSREFSNADGEKETDFFTVIVWGNRAENCAKYLGKGKKIAVIGRLENRSYEDKDGINRTVTEVIAEQVEFLSPKQDDEVVTAVRNRGLEVIDDNQLPF